MQKKHLSIVGRTYGGDTEYGKNVCFVLLICSVKRGGLFSLLAVALARGVTQMGFADGCFR